MKMDTQYGQQGKVTGSRDHGLSEMLQDEGDQIHAKEDAVVLLKQMLQDTTMIEVDQVMGEEKESESS
jgi:hypothetical protein